MKTYGVKAVYKVIRAWKLIQPPPQIPGIKYRIITDSVIFKHFDKYVDRPAKGVDRPWPHRSIFSLISGALIKVEGHIPPI